MRYEKEFNYIEFPALSPSRFPYYGLKFGHNNTHCLAKSTGLYIGMGNLNTSDLNRWHNYEFSVMDYQSAEIFAKVVLGLVEEFKKTRRTGMITEEDVLNSEEALVLLQMGLKVTSTESGSDGWWYQMAEGVVWFCDREGRVNRSNNGPNMPEGQRRTFKWRLLTK